MADNDHKTGQTPPSDDQGKVPNKNLEDIKKKIEEAKKKEEASSIRVPQEELELLKKAKQEAENKALRALADLQNALKRMEDEKTSFISFATQALVIRVLEIYANYHRLMQHKPTDLKMDEWHKGLELIDQQFKSFFESQGVREIPVQVGDKIDPQKHEAMMTGDGPEGQILEVFSPGYEMRGRVIMSAKVKVGKL